MTLPKRIQAAEGEEGIDSAYCCFLFPRRKPNFPQVLEKNGGDDGTRTRDLCRDSAA